jgi:hypothetical protein
MSLFLILAQKTTDVNSLTSDVKLVTNQSENSKSFGKKITKKVNSPSYVIICRKILLLGTDSIIGGRRTS